MKIAALNQASDTLLGLWQWGMDTLYPPRCPSCQAYVSAQGNFCSPCFSQLRMIAEPLCACCGTPFVIAVEGETRCPNCLVAPPTYDAARAAIAYDRISAPLITALKFHDQWVYLERFAQMIQRSGEPMLRDADLLIPVPLHWRRLLRRKFNQSALLAYALSKRTGIPCHSDVLVRTRYTRPQMRMKRKERLRNLHRAFAVPEAAKEMLQDRCVILVDDVITTGATVEACAKALKKAGAHSVRVLALAKTIRE